MSLNYQRMASTSLLDTSSIICLSVWIAAIALQHQFTLIAKDCHFEEIPGLQFKKW